MLLKSLELYAFRNHGQVSLAFETPLQIFTGANALGKTNLVEAVYVLATGRSFRRHAHTRELLAHGEKEASVKGQILRGGLETDLQVRLGQTRRLVVNHNEVHLLRDYVKHLAVVAFSPEDLTLIRGGPDLRRDFIDRAAFTLVPEYLDDFTRYQRALAERNQLLKSGHGGAEMEAWTAELAETGAMLSAARQKFLAGFIPEATAAFSDIFRGVELSLRYHPSPARLLEADVQQWRDVMEEELREREPDDRMRGFTGVGPHRDDLSIELDGRDARIYASQGQARALALAFRIAQIKQAGAVLGANPLFILDDVGSELDAARREYLALFLESFRVQAFITATDRNLLPAFGKGVQAWKLEGGSILPVSTD